MKRLKKTAIYLISILPLLTSSCASQTKKVQEINNEFANVSMIDISTISGNSDWTLMVPEQIDIEFSSASGNFKIKNISGKMKVNTASGNIEAIGIKILDNAEFTSASGNVNVSFAESPGLDVLASSASGEVTLDFNQNPVIGNIEIQARIEIGKINCPFTFDNEREEIFNDQKYLIKSVTLEKNTPSIKIHTASGMATLKK